MPFPPARRRPPLSKRQRRKRDIGTVLSEVPGLGPARVKGLLKHFGSVARLRAADEASIAEVPGIGPALASAIRAHLHGEPQPAAAD